MNTPDSEKVVERFFKALEQLKSDHAIRGIQTFTRRYGICRRNLYQLSKNPASNIFQVAWLGYLVRDYGVSADWLLCGIGPFYHASVQKVCKSSESPLKLVDI